MIVSLKVWQRLLMAIISGLLVAIPFLYSEFYWLMWIAFVPLLLAIEHTNLLVSYALGLVSGLTFSMVAGYWVTEFLAIAKGYGTGQRLLLGCVFWFCGAQAHAIIAVVFTGLRRWGQRYLSVHDFVLFPLVVVSVYSAMPMLFPFHPADTQSRFLSALQAIEFTTLCGLDAVIALVNIMFYRVLFRRFRQSDTKAITTSWLPWGLSSLIVVSWFLYGVVVTRAWDEQLVTWTTITVGVVQPNDTPSLAEPVIFPGYSLAYPPEMAMTEQLAQAGAELVVWPEARYKGYFNNFRVQRAYAERLRKVGVALLFQDAEQVTSRVSTQAAANIVEYNSAVMIQRDGQAQAHYRKMKLMPFGEFVPFSEAFSVLSNAGKRVLREFTASLEPGTEHVVFSLGALTVVPLICYETQFPEFVRSAVSLKRSGTLLVGLSNNGWFGDTREPYQHVNSSILRAVENRLPFLHVLNNGPSTLVLPNGRVVFQTAFREAGGYLVDVPYKPN